MLVLLFMIYYSLGQVRHGRKCLTFDQYMQLTRQQYDKYYSNRTNQPIANIILTSEQASILTRRHNYNTSSNFRFRFVVNENDAGQGTGDPNEYGASVGGPNADAIMMVSSFATLKMQLMAKYTVVNCCSHFHRMILDLLRAGCGAVAKPEFRCLQEMEDPQFHLCCAWDKEERCQRALQKFRRQYKNATQDYA